MELSAAGGRVIHVYSNSNAIELPELVCIQRNDQHNTGCGSTVSFVSSRPQEDPPDYSELRRGCCLKNSKLMVQLVSRVSRELQECFVLVGLFVHRRWIDRQSHLQLLWGPVADCRHGNVCRHVTFLVLHEACIRDRLTL
jgi:hypothetical protein